MTFVAVNDKKPLVSEKMRNQILSVLGGVLVAVAGVSACIFEINRMISSAPSAHAVTVESSAE